MPCYSKGMAMNAWEITRWYSDVEMHAEDEADLTVGDVYGLATSQELEAWRTAGEDPETVAHIIINRF